MKFSGILPAVARKFEALLRGAIVGKGELISAVIGGREGISAVLIVGDGGHGAFELFVIRRIGEGRPVEGEHFAVILALPQGGEVCGKGDFGLRRLPILLMESRGGRFSLGEVERGMIFAREIELILRIIEGEGVAARRLVGSKFLDVAPVDRDRIVGRADFEEDLGSVDPFGEVLLVVPLAVEFFGDIDRVFIFDKIEGNGNGRIVARSVKCERARKAPEVPALAVPIEVVTEVGFREVGDFYIVDRNSIVCRIDDDGVSLCFVLIGAVQ